MTVHPRVQFAVEPWALRVSATTPIGYPHEFDGRTMAQSESLFALSNGHVGLRGSLDEGEPRAVPGSYLNGFFEERPYAHPELGYSLPHAGQTVANVTDGRIIRLIVGDSPLDLRYGHVIDHEQTLDFRSGLLTRRTEWTSPNGRSVRVQSQRLVSFKRRSVAAIAYEVEPLDGDLDIAVQSDLLTNEPMNNGSNSDPRAAADLGGVLVPQLSAGRGLAGVLVHQTRRSHLRCAVGMDHVFDAPSHVDSTLHVADDLARLTIAAHLPTDSKFRMVKFLAYGWSHRRSAAALRDQVEGVLATAKLAGWEKLATEQRDFLDGYWTKADVEIDGDPELQQASRYGLYSVLQATARSEGQAIPAKGLTGPGYDGHAFWDAETFVLPVVTYTSPDAAREPLRWRHSTLPIARERAKTLGHNGAAFPWRTIRGEECSGYWPAGTAAFHVNADIADAVARYVAATEDTEFERDHGVELLVETARLWRSLGHFDAEDQFRIHGVTGPDEYTAVVDDNVYTNLMAQRNLREAAYACERWPEVAHALEVQDDERSEWLRAAQSMFIPYDENLEVHPQSQGFTEHDEWDFEHTLPEHYPLLLNYPYFELYRKQVIKQADLVLAMHLRGDAFSPEEKARNFAYYEARTVRDSSLSAATQAVIAAETGHLDLAYDYWREAALTDLHDIHGNLHQGLHIASLAGGWTVVVGGFGGMRDFDGTLSFAPRLPSSITRIAFHVTYRGRCLHVAVTPESATYRLLYGEPLETSHHGDPVTVSADAPVTLPIPPLTAPEPVTHPIGRTPKG
jgi:alpha,alpha-trehalose phosphorylase